MGYYGYAAGDNYGRAQGDYYMRGDPGFFGSLAKLAGKAVSAVSRIVPIPGAGIVGGLVGQALQRVGGGGPGTALVPTLPQLPAFSPQVATAPSIQIQAGGGPYGRQVLGTIGPGAVCQQKGYHANKSSYYRRSPAGSVVYVEKGSACVRNRKMNPANGRALRKALRRAYAFERIAMRTIKLIHPRKKAKFGGFKARRKKSA